MLPSGPRWKSHVLYTQVVTKHRVVVFYHDPVKCLQALLSHPLFAPHISFIPQKVWLSSVQTVHIYNEWMSGDHAWSLQVKPSFPRNWYLFDSTKDQLPNGATLLGVMLSSNKTNISVMTGNRVAHLLLLSLANINADIHSKGSLHSHVLLTLLLVVSFIHKQTCVRSLLSDWLIHESLDLVLKPLKVAATVGIMMSDPVGNLHYCFTPLVAYIANRHLHGYGLTPWVVSVGTCGYGYGYGCPYPWLYPYPHHGFPITSREMKDLIYIITMPMCSNLRIQVTRNFKQHCIITIQLATRPKRTGLEQPLSGGNWLWNGLLKD